MENTELIITKQNIKEYFYIIEDNFNNGIRTYKNFRKICEILHLDYKKATSKSSKDSMTNELKRYCDFSKIEHKSIIEIKEIYTPPKPPKKIKRKKKSKYAEHAYPLIINLLYSERYNNENFAVLDKYALFNILGFSNDWFYNPSNLDNFSKMVLDELRDNCWEIINHAFSRTIDYLVEYNIVFSEIYLINFVENSSTLSPTIPANEETAKLIQEKSQEVYDDYNCKNGYEFYKNYPYKVFKDSLNEKLKEYGIVYNSTAYKISFTNPSTLIDTEYHKCFQNNSLEHIREDLHNHKLFINNKILPQLYKRNIKEANNYFEPNPLSNHVYMQRKDTIFKFIIEEYKTNHPRELINKTAVINTYINKRNNFIEQIIKIN